MMATQKPAHGDLKVWWIPQVPGKAFEVPVGNVENSESLRRAKLLLKTLADYDLFLFETRNRPDYSNSGGLMVYDDREEDWIDWYDSEGRYIEDVPEEELSAVVWAEDA